MKLRQRKHDEAEQMARENAAPLSSAKCFALGALGLSPAAERDAEESQRRAEAQSAAWRLFDATH